jgi:SOS-response transcriptional repressor LexA
MPCVALLICVAMADVLSWLLHRMELVGIRSQTELAEVSGVSLRTVNRIFSERSFAGIERSTRLWLARTLKVSVKDLDRLERGEIDTIADDRIIEWEHAAQGRTNRGDPNLIPVGDQENGIPIMGRVAAGGMVESYEDWDADNGKRLPIKFAGAEGVYALEIVGDSMSPNYLPGEFVILQNIATTDLRDGEDAMVQLDGSGDGLATFKRVYMMGEGRLKLVPLNQKYEPLNVDAAKVSRVGRVCGKFTPPRLIK